MDNVSASRNTFSCELDWLELNRLTGFPGEAYKSWKMTSVIHMVIDIGDSCASLSDLYMLVVRVGKA